MRCAADDLTAAIGTVDADVARILAATGPVEAGRELPALTAALAVRADLAAQAAAVEQQRGLLVTSATGYPPPRVLDRATAPTSPEPSGAAQDLALATLVGLLLGIAVATTLETLWPRVHDANGQAEALGTVLLGEFRRVGSALQPDDLDALVSRMKEAARAKGVQLVSLLVVGDLARNVKARTAIVDELRTHARDLDLRLSPLHHVGANDSEADSDSRGRTTPKTIGLAVLSSSRVRRQDLDAIDQLRRAHGSAIVGLASIRPASRRFGALSRVAYVAVNDTQPQERNHGQSNL